MWLKRSVSEFHVFSVTRPAMMNKRKSRLLSRVQSLCEHESKQKLMPVNGNLWSMFCTLTLSYILFQRLYRVFFVYHNQFNRGAAHEIFAAIECGIYNFPPEYLFYTIFCSTFVQPAAYI